MKSGEELSLVLKLLLRSLIVALSTALAVLATGPARAGSTGWAQWRPIFAPCDGNCATSIYAGWYIENALNQIVATSPETPFTWDYDDDYLVATAASRRIATLWNHVDIEPEVGIGQRFGKQSQTEVWGAFFFRYRGFPWDRYLINTVAISSGFNYANGISDREQERAHDGKGSQLMHFFAPEITFALPRAPQYELMFRVHHRSGVFGLVSDAWGGAQYGTIGLRVRF